MVLLTPSLAKETFTTLTGQGRQLKEGAARAVPLKWTGYSQILKRASSRLSLMNFVLRKFFEEAVFRGKGCHQHAINLCCKPQYYCDQY